MTIIDKNKQTYNESDGFVIYLENKAIDGDFD
jgi:hypothetical protein